MGLFDKLFGGNAKPDAGDNTSAPTPAPAPVGTGAAPVARRERSKPQPLGANASANAAAPMDGENAALLAGIAAVVANDNAQTRTSLYTTILSSELYLVSMTPEGAQPLPAGEVTLQEGQQLSLATIRDGEGRVFLPAFTDIERLTLSLPEGDKARYLRVAASAVCRMFLQGEGEGIVINPGQAPTGIITRHEAQVLAAGSIPQIDENGQMVAPASQQQMRVMIAKPDVPPSESMIAAILAEAPKHERIREIHVFKAGVEDQPARLMIGLAMDEGMAPEEMQPTFQTLGQAAFDARGETEPFDMMPLNEQLLEAIRPLEAVVYRRG